MIGDMNKDLSPTMQRLLFGTMVVSGVATVVIFTIALLIHGGYL